VEHEITMSGRGHGFDENLDDPQVTRAFERVVKFLKEHLG
jgi:hypothetical protein